MDKDRLVANAAASLLALGIRAAAPASQAAGMEQCFGIAEAGRNDCTGVHHCAALSGLHGCKGAGKGDDDSADFKLVPAGLCARTGGLDLQQAAALLKHPRAVKAYEARLRQRSS